MKTVCVYFIFQIFGYVLAMTDEEALMKVAKHIITCSKDSKPPVDVADLIKIQNLQPPTKPEMKCVLACAYRRMGTLKADGMFDLEAGYKLAQEVAEGDEKRLENGKKLADICTKVNDENVSDGEKGCERAVLMFKCLTGNAPKLGFKTKLDPASISKLTTMW